MAFLKKTEDRLVNGVIIALMMLFSLTIILPFWFLLVDSFSTPEFVLKSGIKFWPDEIDVSSYQKVFQSEIVGIAYINTIIRTVLGTALSMLICFAAAYALSKTELPFGRILTAFVLIPMFFSGGIIPTYLWFKELGLLNTRFIQILPRFAIPYYILIMRNFIRALPNELEESAYIDGANTYQIFFRIIIPLSMPVLATVGLWAAVAFWNDWFQALMFTPQKSLMVLQLMLRRVLIENQIADMEIVDTGSSLVSDQSLKAATMFVTIGPIIAVYPFIQRYFVKGVMVGSVKG